MAKSSTPSLNGTRSPPETQDASRVLPKGPSVNDDSVRKSNAMTAKTLGPRTA